MSFEVLLSFKGAFISISSFEYVSGLGFGIWVGGLGSKGGKGACCFWTGLGIGNGCLDFWSVRLQRSGF